MKNWSNYRVVYSPSPPSRTEQRNEALEAEPSRSADAQGVDDGVNANAVCAYRDNAFKMAPSRGADDDDRAGGDGDNADARAHHDDAFQGRRRSRRRQHCARAP